MAAGPGHLPLLYRALSDEHSRAQQVKASTPVLVCLGNPPYDRESREPSSLETTDRRKGGWIRFGDVNRDGAGLIRDFIDPLNATGAGIHAKNLYNDYVYFWRWALWKVFETKDTGGIVSFITASSYLTGPGFAGMRQVMRRIFDEMWIIDLEGGNLGARKTENVFEIQTPVAIAIGIRVGDSDTSTPAVVHYTRIEGTQKAKLDQLRSIDSFSDLVWRSTASDWAGVFLPMPSANYEKLPKLIDVFPWQASGVQFKRSWPIGETPDVLRDRWSVLMAAPNRAPLFRETGDRVVSKQYEAIGQTRSRLPSIDSLPGNTPAPVIIPYAFRSFDRQFALYDGRLGDRLRPELFACHSDEQVYFTSLLTEVLGEGPAAVVCSSMPDLHHFRGSFGGRHVVPLWRDREATLPNVTLGLLETLSEAFGHVVSPHVLFGYAYATLSSTRYVKVFWDELLNPGPRLPITKDWALFEWGSRLGITLTWLHTYGERFVASGLRRGDVPAGQARCAVGTPGSPDKYPNSFRYNPSTQTLEIGDALQGIFENVSRDVWEFSLSGFRPVESWLAFRMKDRAGKASSPLDAVRPTSWTFDQDLLRLLWVIEHTTDLRAEQDAWMDQIVQSELFVASELPQPTDKERERSVGIASVLEKTSTQIRLI